MMSAMLLRFVPIKLEMMDIPDLYIVIDCKRPLCC